MNKNFASRNLYFYKINLHKKREPCYNSCIVLVTWCSHIILIKNISNWVLIIILVNTNLILQYRFGFIHITLYPHTCYRPYLWIFLFYLYFFLWCVQKGWKTWSDIVVDIFDETKRYLRLKQSDSIASRFFVSLTL